MNKNLILKKLNSLQELKKSSKYWNITWEQGIFISNLIDIKKPKRILEIGTSNGFSTLWLAKNLSQDSKIITIEVSSQRIKEAKKNFDFCQLDNIECKQGDVYEVLEDLNQGFDFVFIDAEQEHYNKLLNLLEKKNLVNENTILLFDNILNHDSTKNFPDLVDESKYHKEIVCIGSGMLFLHKN